MALRWGIVGAGLICHDFVEALRILPPNEHKVVAVGARSAERAVAFADAHKIPKSYGNYKSLAEDADVDVVYIGVVNIEHFNVCMLMVKHGKHVLCEKPLALNKKEVEEMFHCANTHKVLLMEAMWSRFFPLYKQLRNQIDSGVIGDVAFINVQFGFPIQHTDRIRLKALGGGTTLDLGVYGVQFLQFVLKDLEPNAVTCVGQLNLDGVDVSVNSLFTYSKGISAVVSLNAMVALTNEAVVVGTKGIIRIPNFWCPTELILPTTTMTFDLPKTSATFNFINSAGLCYEAEHVGQCLKDGLLESPVMPSTESKKMIHMTDTIRKKIGVVFPQDV